MNLISPVATKVPCVDCCHNISCIKDVSNSFVKILCKCIVSFMSLHKVTHTKFFLQAWKQQKN